jgi:hypothetical protein
MDCLNANAESIKNVAKQLERMVPKNGVVGIIMI